MICLLGKNYHWRGISIQKIYEKEYKWIANLICFFINILSYLILANLIAKYKLKFELNSSIYIIICEVERKLN